MSVFKPISKKAIPGALAKAERYRLLNEPREAESICCDILQVDPVIFRPGPSTTKPLCGLVIVHQASSPRPAGEA